MNLQDMTLEECMLAYQAGQPLAFEEIYRRTVGRSRAWLRLRVPSAERGEDLLQRAYFKLHRARHQYRSGEVFEAWFFSILRNTWVDDLRTQGRKPDQNHALSIDEVSESALPSTGHPSDAGTAGSEAVLEDAVEGLAGHHREALEMRYQDGTSFGGLAKHWKVSEAAARKRVSRAVHALKERLGLSELSAKQEEKNP